MSNPEHLERLRLTAEGWNDWRDANPAIRPDFAGADLRGTDLSNRDFSASDFSGADLSGAILQQCLLNASKFVGARATAANFVASNLEWVRALDADFTEANLIRCVLDKASFEDAKLIRANLASARFDTSILTRADLADAYLGSTHFIRTQMQGVNFAGTKQGLTVFVDVTLVGATGLDRCEHASFNMIDFRTLINSAGQLPLQFLRGCGLPEGVIRQYLAHWDEFSFVASAFISHSSRDEMFVNRLVDSLQELGVRCFYSRRDMRAGAPQRETLYAQIDANDFVVCVMSADALASNWVRDEIEHAFATERERQARVVIPLRIDAAPRDTRVAWAVALREDRHIEDFTSWDNPRSYDMALKRLVEALKHRR